MKISIMKDMNKMIGITVFTGLVTAAAAGVCSYFAAKRGVEDGTDYVVNGVHDLMCDFLDDLNERDNHSCHCKESSNAHHPDEKEDVLNPKIHMIEVPANCTWEDLYKTIMDSFQAENEK